MTMTHARGARGLGWDGATSSVGLSPAWDSVMNSGVRLLMTLRDIERTASIE